jgi:peptidyl-prolyl cis-trans isomerase D
MRSAPVSPEVRDAGEAGAPQTCCVRADKHTAVLPNNPIYVLILMASYISMHSCCLKARQEITRKGAASIMLGIMRKYKQSIIIKIVFTVIVLSFVGTIFLVWGRGGSKGGGGVDYAARVNGTKISIEEYQKSYYRVRNIYEQLSRGGMTPEMEKQLGIRKIAIDNLVNGVLVRDAADQMGIKVSKDDVQKAIEAVPAFQKNGAFDFQQYQQVLRSNRLTPSTFEEEEKQDLMVQKARTKIQDSASVSDDEILQEFRKRNDRIVLSFASFAPADMKSEIKLTDQDLNTYLQAHQERFRVPEQIAISYCILSPASVAAKLSVSEDEAQTYYRKNIDHYQGKGGILPYEEVKARVKADALLFKGARQAYEMAADAINKNKSGNIAAAASSFGLKVTDTPLFTADAPPANLASENEVVKRAFATKVDELGGPVETSKGIYILKVKERKPAAVPPLDRIRSQVEQAARADKARELAAKKAEQAVADLTKGNSSLKLKDTGSFGYSPKGDIPGLGTSPEIMTAAFTLTTTAPVAKKAFQVGDRWYVIKLKSRTELNKENFAKEKEQIRQSLLPRKQQEVMDAWMKELRAKAKIEINPSLVAD